MDNGLKFLITMLLSVGLFAIAMVSNFIMNKPDVKQNVTPFKKEDIVWELVSEKDHCKLYRRKSVKNGGVSIYWSICDSTSTSSLVSY